MIKRERWTEQEVRELPSGEPDTFERKSGRLFSDKEKFLDSVAKALSAFANSGGGSLLIGVEDDGVLTGLPAHVGGATMREWLEQKLPNLLDYPLSDFRVHDVERAATSDIPEGAMVIVIDVGDSALAPHQSKRDNRYYHRAAGRSLPAPHFYIELLRQRLTSPTLQFAVADLQMKDAYQYESGLFVELKATWNITNVGRMAAYKWQLQARHLWFDDEGPISARLKDFYFGMENYPLKKSRESSILLDGTILPGCSITYNTDIGVMLRPSGGEIDHRRSDLELMIAKLKVDYQLATEFSPGERTAIEFSTVANMNTLLARSLELCPAEVEENPSDKPNLSPIRVS